MTLPNGVVEIDAALIISEIISSIAARVPEVQLTGAVGEPVPMGEAFDVDDLDDEDKALVALGQQIRPLEFDVTFRGELAHGGATTTTDLSPARWVSFAGTVLSTIQDVISVETTEPWPEARVEGRRKITTEHVVIKGHYLHMWFGEESNPVLLFTPVKITKNVAER